MTRNNPNLVSETIASQPSNPKTKCCKISKIYHAGNAENFVMLYLSSFINPHKLCLKSTTWLLSLGTWEDFFGTIFRSFQVPKFSSVNVQSSQKGRWSPQSHAVESPQTHQWGWIGWRIDSSQWKLKIQTSYISILEIGNTWNELTKYYIYTSFIWKIGLQKKSRQPKAHGLLISSAAPSPSVFFC